jgi:hypothetical protein
VFSYDRHGNLYHINPTKCSAPSMYLSVNSATNRVTADWLSYDAAGNLTNDGTHPYTWDAENHLTQPNSYNFYGYDGDERRLSASALARRYRTNGGRACASYFPLSPFQKLNAMALSSG